jgi:hypothetical protein
MITKINKNGGVETPHTIEDLSFLYTSSLDTLCLQTLVYNRLDTAALQAVEDDFTLLNTITDKYVKGCIACFNAHPRIPTLLEQIRIDRIEVLKEQYQGTELQQKLDELDKATNSLADRDKQPTGAYLTKFEDYAAKVKTEYDLGITSWVTTIAEFAQLTYTATLALPYPTFIKLNNQYTFQNEHRLAAERDQEAERKRQQQKQR